MKNNNVSLILSRISLAITSIYVFFILYLIISTTYRVDHGEKDLQVGFGMMFGFLLPHLIALVITTILNIIISLKNSHTYPLVITTFILYIITAFRSCFCSFHINSGYYSNHFVINVLYNI